MNIEQQLRTDYQLGEIAEIRDISTSANCYLIVTDDGSFVFKHAGRLDFVQAYEKAAQALRAQGLIAARLCRTKVGSFLTEQGFSLTEYIAGDTPESFTDSQFREAVLYISRFNRALRGVPFGATELLAVNVWDKVKSTDFLCDNINNVLDGCEFSPHDRQFLSDAGKLLVENRNFLQSSRKQLIHTDLGPGNIVFSDGRVRTIIDFTPEYENELYSLAQFLFWTCLWKGEASTAANKVLLAINAYDEADHQQDVGCAEHLFIYLLKACLFRTFGPVLNMLEQGRCDASRVASRVQAMKTLFQINDRIWRR